MISLVNASSFKTGTPININIPCVNDGNQCSGNSTCQITVFFPDSSVFVNGSLMTNNGNYHNLTLPKTDISGTYTASVYCEDGTDHGHVTFIFDVENVTDISFCPNTTHGLIKLIIGLAIAFALVLLGLFRDSGIFGLLGSFTWFFVSFQLINCFFAIGTIMMILSFIMIIKFSADLFTGNL